MAHEMRKMVNLAAEVIFLSGLVLIVALAATAGRNSVNAFSEQQAMRPNLSVNVELTRGTIGFYELTDTIDFYAPSIDVHIEYTRNGTNYKLTFTSSSEGGRAGDGAIRLLVSSSASSTKQYRRNAGALYRDGLKLSIASGHELLASDMGLPASTLSALRNLPGNAMLGYEFTKALFEWAQDERFVCTVTQSYDTSDIEAITLRLI